MSKCGRVGREAKGDGVEEGVVKVSDEGLLLEDVCRVSEKEGRPEAVLRVCSYEREGRRWTGLLG